MLAEMERDQKNATISTNAVTKIANNTTTLSAEKIKEFERVRLARLCAYLRQLPPLAQIGYSIFVFNLSDNELDQALNGPPVELAREISVIGY